MTPNHHASTRTPSQLIIDHQRLAADLDVLADITEPGEPGWTRRVFSPAYRESRDLISSLMREAGLQVRCDEAGNVIGERPGRTSGAAALVTGSHTDTVRGGGRYDGIIGVLGAIEVVRSLDRAGVELDRPIRVVDFLGEEPNRFGVSCIGSRAIAGVLDAALLAETDVDGSSLADALVSWGLTPSAVPAAAWPAGSVHAFVELHIEQGPVLDDAEEQIGVVTGIYGVRRSILHCRGRADHAGTTPMDRRRDAMALAAEVVAAVERAADDGAGVATVGRIEVRPNAVNVVPATADCWIELRSIDPSWTAERAGRIHEAATEAAERRGLEISEELLSDDRPTLTSPEIRQAIRGACHDLNVSHRDLPSGAEHDAHQIARIAPYGMVFVPSADGRSHTPEEHTDIDDIARGCQVLAATLVRLDTTPLPSLRA